MNNSTFNGFEPANTTPVPDIFFDELLAELNNAELRTLLYIFRRTTGFKKDSDAISFNQFLHGITTKDGRVLDKGCGIKDRTTLSKALASLETRGCIQSRKGKDPQGDNATTFYSIRFCSEVVGKSYHPIVEGSREIIPPVVVKTDYRGMENRLPVVGKSYQQETVIQLDSLQETVIQQDGAHATASHRAHENDSHYSPEEMEDDVLLRDDSRYPTELPVRDSDGDTGVLHSPTAIQQTGDNSYSPTRQQAGRERIDATNHHRDTALPGHDLHSNHAALDHGDVAVHHHHHGHLEQDDPAYTPGYPLGATATQQQATSTAISTPPPSVEFGVQDSVPNPVVVGGNTKARGGRGRAKGDASEKKATGVGRKTRKKAEPVDLFASLEPSVQAVIVEWQGIFKKPVPVTEALVKQATILVAFQPESGEVAACRLWMYATDENKWYSTHGMHLGDVAREFGRFRSLSDVPKVTPIRIEKTDSPRYTKLPMPAAASHAKLPKPPVMIGGAR